MNRFQILVLKALAICINLLRAMQKNEVLNSYAYQIEKEITEAYKEYSD